MATEEPEFILIHKENNFEIREYPPRFIAQVNVSGDFDSASSEGFKALANYIFGNNTLDGGSHKIAMTAPVLSQRDNNDWLITFVMPKEYTFENLPKPNNSEVKILELPAEKYAVVIFSGLVRESSYNEKSQLLSKFVVSKK